MAEDKTVQEAIGHLRDRIAELRRQRSAVDSTDRIVDLVGDACAIAGLLLFIAFSVDPLSATLSILGIGILGYNRLVRLPRIRAREQERRRQIDMLQSRVDQMERELMPRKRDDR